MLSGLGCGAAPRLTDLSLVGTGLGTAGASALAAALSRGALPKLVELYMGRNEMDDEGLPRNSAGRRQGSVIPTLE